MCHDNVKITLEFPNVVGPDKNGVVYTKEALEKALAKLEQGGPVPLTVLDPCPPAGVQPFSKVGDGGPRRIVGSIHSAKMEGDSLIVSGILDRGGTTEMVDFAPRAEIEVSGENPRTVTTMNIKSIGLVASLVSFDMATGQHILPTGPVGGNENGSK